MKQKTEKIELLEQINQKNLNFQMVRNLQKELDEKDQKIKELKRRSKNNTFTRKRNMTLSSVISRQKQNSMALETFRNSLSKGSKILF